MSEPVQAIHIEPSAFSCQIWGIILINGKGLKDKLSPIPEVPCCLLLVKQPHRFIKGVIDLHEELPPWLGAHQVQGLFMKEIWFHMKSFTGFDNRSVTAATSRPTSVVSVR